MSYKSPFYLLLLFSLLALAACNVARGAEEPITEAPLPAATPTAEVVEAECAEATPGTHQLIDAAQGICFLFPDNYDVYPSEGGHLTLYVRSLLNTGAPIASIDVYPAEGRTLQDIIAPYVPDVDLTTALFQTVDLGAVKGTVLNNLPGQDINRRVIAFYEDRVIDIMIARIGEEYGDVGIQAEALYSTITGSFQFIDIDPDAMLIAGPECPEAGSGMTLFTNTEDGFCLLLPEGFTVDDSLTSNDGGNETVFYIDSMLNMANARLFITVDAARSRSLEEITAAKQAEIEAILGTSAMWSFGYMLDGVPANQFDQVPGQDFSRQLLLVRNDLLYTLTFIPDDPEMSDAYAEMQTLYEIVLDSFSFLQ